MDTPPLYVAIPLLPSVRDLIARRRRARFSEGEERLSTDEIIRLARGAREVMISGRNRFDAAALRALPASVEVLATYSVGFDHIDLAAAADRGIAVLNTPDVLTDAVAETAMLLCLGAARRATESIMLLRDNRWSGWSPTQLPGLQITGRRMGIYGMGRIGRCIARRAAAFEMPVHYHGRRRLDAVLEGSAIYHADEADFLSRCDVLVLACAAAPETELFLNAERIARLPRDAIVVNIARGSIVDDDALVAALGAGEIFAAGLDVFNNEPDLDPRYLKLPNAFLLPHIGSSTIDARLQMAAILIDGLESLEAGLKPDNLLTPHNTEACRNR